jgi:hypothetical protein
MMVVYSYSQFIKVYEGGKGKLWNEIGGSAGVKAGDTSQNYLLYLPDLVGSQLS